MDVVPARIKERNEYFFVQTKPDGSELQIPVSTIYKKHPRRLDKLEFYISQLIANDARFLATKRLSKPGPGDIGSPGYGAIVLERGKKLFCQTNRSSYEFDRICQQTSQGDIYYVVAILHDWLDEGGDPHDIVIPFGTDKVDVM